MGLMDFATTAPEETGFKYGAMGGGLDVGNVLTALGQSLLTSTRQNPLANFGTALQQADARSEKKLERQAVILALRKAGLSEEDATALSLSPLAAKLAVDAQATTRGEEAARRASSIMSGGTAADTSAAPRMSPSAPAGPAAGASLNGDAATGFVDTLVGIESGGNPNARNPNSTATGLTQFTNGTWGDMMRLHPELGLTPDGRTDPAQARKAAIAYAQDNGKLLAEAGHEVTPGNLYLGHFLGGPGASRFLRGLSENPDAPAASYADPDAVAANRSVFTNRDGTYKTARDFYSERTSKFGGGAPTRVAALPGADPLAGYTPTPGGGADNPDPGARSAGPAPLPPAAPSSPFGRPVQVANNEAETQILEGRMNMLPRDVYGIVPPAASPPGAGLGRPMIAQADMPAPDARPAEFRIPPGSSGAQTPPEDRTIFNDKITAMQAVSRATQALAVPNLPEATRRALEAQRSQAQEILKPTDQTRKLMDAGYRPGTPEFQEAARRLTFGEKEDKERLVGEFNQRRTIADSLGMVPGSPERLRFEATGKYPGEDKPVLTAGDKKAIFEAEDALPVIEQTISSLTRAKKLNPKTYMGVTAQAMGRLGTSGTFDALFDQEKAKATREFGQIMSMEAIQSMAKTLKGATTDTEMARFMEILGDPSTPVDIREQTIDRMLTLAQRQKEIAEGRIHDLRGGDYFKKDRGQPSASGQASGNSNRPNAPPAEPSLADYEAEARRRGLIR